MSPQAGVARWAPGDLRHAPIDDGLLAAVRRGLGGAREKGWGGTTTEMSEGLHAGLISGCPGPSEFAAEIDPWENPE